MSERKGSLAHSFQARVKMANTNVEEYMEVETTNPAESTDSNEINIIINCKT